MGRKEDLETHIRESHDLIQQYETIVRETDRPKERKQAERVIDEQWELVKHYLGEYIPLCEQLGMDMPNDILEIAARFRDLVLSKASIDLQKELGSEGLAEPEQAVQTIASSIPVERPLIFQTGLCPGYPLTPSPHQYFVAQEFSPDRDDLLQALEATFREFNLLPYRADQDISPGHILCKIAAKIQTTLFSVFELTRAQNRNVYMELGVAIGLGCSFVLVKEADAEVSLLAQGLEYYNIRSYTGLRWELGNRLRQYLMNITRYRGQGLSSVSPNDTYVIAHGDYDMPVETCVTLAETLAEYGLTPVLIGDDNNEASQFLTTMNISHQIITGTGKTQLDTVTQAIQTARFGIYRIDQDCSPDTFLALGIAIGLNRPWALIWRDDATLPADVRGLNGLPFRSFTDLGRQFPQRFMDFLRKYT